MKYAQKTHKRRRGAGTINKRHLKVWLTSKIKKPIITTANTIGNVSLKRSATIGDILTRFPTYQSYAEASAKNGQPLYGNRLEDAKHTWDAMYDNIAQDIASHPRIDVVTNTKIFVKHINIANNPRFKAYMDSTTAHVTPSAPSADENDDLIKKKAEEVRRANLEQSGIPDHKDHDPTTEYDALKYFSPAVVGSVNKLLDFVQSPKTVGLAAISAIVNKFRGPNRGALAALGGGRFNSVLVGTNVVLGTIALAASPVRDEFLSLLNRFTNFEGYPRYDPKDRSLQTPLETVLEDYGSHRDRAYIKSLGKTALMYNVDMALAQSCMEHLESLPELPPEEDYDRAALLMVAISETNSVKNRTLTEKVEMFVDIFKDRTITNRIMADPASIRGEIDRHVFML